VRRVRNLAPRPGSHRSATESQAEEDRRPTGIEVGVNRNRKRSGRLTTVERLYQEVMELPPDDLQRLIEMLSQVEPSEPAMTEEEFQMRLVSEGIISELPVVWTLLKTRAAPKRRARVRAGKCVAKSLPARTRGRRLSVKTKVS
jgi:hypothetical protein